MPSHLKTLLWALPTNLRTQPHKLWRQTPRGHTTRCLSGAALAWEKHIFCMPSKAKWKKTTPISTLSMWTVKNLQTKLSAPFTITPPHSSTTNTARQTCFWWTISSLLAARNLHRKNFSTLSTHCIIPASRLCWRPTVPRAKSKAWKTGCAPALKWG